MMVGNGIGWVGGGACGERRGAVWRCTGDGHENGEKMG